MTEFKKARDEAAFKIRRENNIAPVVVSHREAWCEGADWAYKWCLLRHKEAMNRSDKVYDQHTREYQNDIRKLKAALQEIAECVALEIEGTRIYLPMSDIAKNALAELGEQSGKKAATDKDVDQFLKENSELMDDLSKSQK